MKNALLHILGRVHDAAVALIAIYLAFIQAYGWNRFGSIGGIHEKAAIFVIIAIVCFYVFSLNRGTWRYASIPDLVAIIKASVAALFVFTLIMFLVSRGHNLPRSVIPLTATFMILGLSGPRLAYRMAKDFGLFEVFQRKENERRVLLYQIDDNGESFIRAVRRSRETPLTIVGIIDDRYSPGLTVQGVAIRGGMADLCKVVEKLKRRGQTVSELVITDPALDRTRIRQVVTAATEAGLKVTRIPNLSDTATHNSHGIRPDPVSLTDLIGRPEVMTDTAAVARLIADQTVMITGAGGSIGSELSRQIASFGPRQLVLTDISEYFLYAIDSDIREKYPQLAVSARIADIRDKGRISTLMRQYAPDVIFHAAALKHVPLMEQNVLESMKTNILGTMRLADAAIEHSVKTMVMISTDKAVNPTSMMGATKRAAEIYCQTLDRNGSLTRFNTVRFGNVIGSHGSVVPKFDSQIARGGPVTVTHPDVVRYFMSIPEAVRLLLQASVHAIDSPASRGKILVLEMGEPIKVADLARRMIELSGSRPDIDIEIRYTGLRQGEKLFEELFAENETLQALDDSGYLVAQPTMPVRPELMELFVKLEDAVAMRNQEAAVSILKRIVPEYAKPHTYSDNVVSLSQGNWESRKRAGSE